MDYLVSSNAGYLEKWSERMRRLGGRDIGNLTDDNIRAATSIPETISELCVLKSYYVLVSNTHKFIFNLCNFPAHTS